MKGPFELLSDLYDYQYQYYRWYLHNRLLFSDVKGESLMKPLSYNIFSNEDSENLGQLIQTTTMLGFGTGALAAPFKYIQLTELRSKGLTKALPASIGVLVVCTGIGLAYGSLVNAISNYRGGKSDYKNHALAALMTIPATGVYAKSNKLQWGLINGIVLAASAAFLKTSYTGGLPGYPYRTPNKVYPGTTPSYYKN